MQKFKEIVDRLQAKRAVSDEEYKILLQTKDEKKQAYLHKAAREVCQSIYGNGVFIRGLIEISNYCKNDCYYCGIRRSNHHVSRYHLNKEEILSACKQGYALGFKTFVMQGGEDGSYDDVLMVDIIKSIRTNYPDCAITLSLGEKSKDVYQKYFDAGANRYLLRHESVCENHYAKLHPSNMRIQDRVQCLWDLKEIGFQVGSGIMVGSPYQTLDHIVADIHFLEKLQPQMIGLGPYLPHKDTPFKDEKKGDVEMTINLLAILRLMHPQALIPSTTALATISNDGREKGILAGANVVMPNLSPVEHREAYSLYNNKANMNAEAAESLHLLEARLQAIGYTISYDRGDYKKEGET